MADTTEQLQELNQNATLLLQKYDGVFSKLTDEATKVLLAIANKSEEGLTAITNLLADGEIDLSQVLGKEETAVNSLKLDGKTLDEVVQYMIDNQPEPVSTISKFDIFEDGSSKALYPFNNNTNDIGGQFNATAVNHTYANGGIKFNGAGSFGSLPKELLIGSENRDISFHAIIPDNGTNVLLGMDYNGQRGIVCTYTKNGTVVHPPAVEGSSRNNSFYFYLSTNNNTTNFNIDYADMPIGVRVHIKISLDFINQKVTISVNGNEIGSYSVSGMTNLNPSYNFPIYLGSQRYSNKIESKGIIFSQFRVFNRIITDSTQKSQLANELG